VTPQEEDLIRRISSVIGHEFRNSLAVLSNSLYFIRSKIENDALSPKIKKHFGFLGSEILNLDGMIARAEAYSKPLDPKPELVSLNEFIKNFLEGFELPPKIKIREKLVSSNPKIRVDERLLADVFRSLIKNAIEAIGEKGEITISSEVSSIGVSASVLDSGQGLKSEDLVRLFEPFATTKPRGLGLGLAHAKKIIEVFGGRIEGKNIPSGGASFTLCFPKI
jgi:signal transduction histidine kinase